jgi:hypothetical protein
MAPVEIYNVSFNILNMEKLIKGLNELPFFADLGYEDTSRRSEKERKSERVKERALIFV